MAAILTDSELGSMSLEVAKNPAFLATLSTYEKQALNTYAIELSEGLAARTKDEQHELREIFPPCNVADDVLKLLAGSVARAASTEPAQCPLLTLAEIALLLVYSDVGTNQTLTREQAKEHAAEWGHTSGDRLYNFYCLYAKRNNRVGFDELTNKKGQNMAARIKKVLQFLPHDKIDFADNEIDAILHKIS